MAEPALALHPEPGLRVAVATTGVCVVDRLRVADTHWTRLRGLLGTSGLAGGEGLWIRPCRQIHMFGMRYPIDAVFLDAEGTIVHLIEELAPGRVSPRIAEAASVLELPAGTIARTKLRQGTRLVFDGTMTAPARDATLPRVGAIACNLLLAGLYLVFALAHVDFARRTGEWMTTMPLVLQEALLVVLFLTRRRSLATSTRLYDWVIGIAGVFLPLLVRATGGAGVPWLWLGQALQASGLALAVVSVAFLGRSIGVVAANRGIKTAGMYAVVRHPMYAAYMVSYVGYALVHPSLWNLGILGMTLVALNARAAVEERFLARDPAYDAYQRRVRWRFVPGVY